MRALLLLSLAICCAPSVFAALGRVITHQDLWLMPRVSAPQISPDGAHAVFSVTNPAYTPEQQSQDLWLVSTDGKQAPRQLTQSKAPETGASWSFDSQRLAFSSQRDGDLATQIYLLDIRGGEAKRVTNTALGARAPKFSADGKSLIYLSNGFLGASVEAEQQAKLAAIAERKTTARVYEGFPIRYWDKWLDDKVIRPMQIDLETSKVTDLFGKSELIKQPGYGGRFVESAEEMEIAVSKTGAVIFGVSTNRHRAAFSFTHADLYLLQPGSDEPRRLTGDSENGVAAGDDFARASFSADGKTLYALRTPRTDKVYNSNVLMAFDFDGAALSNPRELALPERLAISSYALVGDSIVLSAEFQGTEQLWRTDRKLTKAIQITALAQGVLSGLSAASGKIVGSFESAQQPLQIVGINLASSKASFQALSRFGSKNLSELQLSQAEHFTSARQDGSKIHSMLIRPANFDPSKRYPMLTLIHGGPHIMWRDAFFLRWNYHLIASDKFVVLLTNYRGSTGAGEAFAQEIQGDPFKGPTADLELAVDDALARFAFIDQQRMCAGGASYGGHLANWIQAVNTTRYRCLISHAGLVNTEAQWGTSDSIYGREVNAGGPVWEQGPVWREQNPIRLAKNFKTPVLVTIGELDYRVPLNNTLEYWSALQRMQVPSRLVVFPDENHWILKGENSRFFYAELKTWLERHLLEESAQVAQSAIAPAGASEKP